MRYILITFLFTISSIIYGQSYWNNCEPTNQVPPPVSDSVFVLVSDSRDGVNECRGEWQSHIDASLVRCKVYVCELSQTSTDTPTANVLYNTFDNELTWIRRGVGEYALSSQSTEFIGVAPDIQVFIDPRDTDSFLHGYKEENDLYYLDVYDGVAGVKTDGLDAVMIEIRVYQQ
jgi:hypothetical protein